MAFVRPSLTDLAARIQEDLSSRLALVAPILRRSVVYALARVIAGAAHLLHGHLDYLSRQIFPDLSDTEFLVRQAALFSLTRKAAAFALGPVVANGTDGTVIPTGSVMLRADGAAYVTTADATIAAGVATVNVTASLAGAAGNCAAGGVLSFESPIAGIYSTATVATGGIVNGSDEESDDSLRARLLDRLRQPPHGGNAADYIAWAREVAGVTRAWCYPLELGAGTVVVRFVRDDDASLIPDAGEVAAVQTHIDGVRPVTATVTVQAPIADPLAYTLHIVPDTAAIRLAVDAELKDLQRRVAEPGVTSLLSQIRGAIGIVDGLTDYTLTVPASDVTHAVGHMAVHSTITWA